MPLGDRNDAEKLLKDWDRIVGRDEFPKKQSSAPLNPYDTQVEDEEDITSNDDINLHTAYTLLATFGFTHPLGEMMAYSAEKRLTYTINQLFSALEQTRGSNNVKVAELKENIRGMIAMAYAWAYVMAKTGKLSVKDRHIFGHIAHLSSTETGSPEREALTKSAEVNLEATLGLLLQALDLAKRQGKSNLQLFYTGSIQMLYSLSNASGE